MLNTLRTCGYSFWHPNVRIIAWKWLFGHHALNFSPWFFFWLVLDWDVFWGCVLCATKTAIDIKTRVQLFIKVILLIWNSVHFKKWCKELSGMVSDCITVPIFVTTFLNLKKKKWCFSGVWKTHTDWETDLKLTNWNK